MIFNKSLGLIGLVAISAFPYAVQSEYPTDNERLSVTVIALEKVAVPIERDVEAELIGNNNTPISAQLSASVEEIKVKVGDQVFEEDVLAVLDCRDFEATLTQANAGVESVKARIVATQARVSAAESRVDAASSRAAAAGSRVQAAETRVLAAQSQVAAAGSRADAVAARIQSATANMQSVGTRIQTAKSQVNTAKAQFAAAGARVPAAQAQVKLAQSQFQRNQQLVSQKLIAADVFDQTRASYDSAQSNLKAVQQDAGAARAAVSTAEAGISEAQGAFRAAQSEVEAAKADLQTAKAEVETQKANAAIARSEVETVRADASTAETDIETARAEWEAAQADLAVVETELASALAQADSAEINVERCQITAPFSGQVVERSLQLGQLAAPGAVAFRLLQIEGMEVSAHLSADEIRDLKQAAEISFNAGDESLKLALRTVIAEMDKTTGTQEARFIVDDLHSLPAGMSGRLRWQGKLPAVPASWLLRRDGSLGLMLARDNKAEFYPLANAQEGQPALVDLPMDTLLINDNRLRARDGQAIQRVSDSE